jgi:hypothetical protein
MTNEGVEVGTNDVAGLVSALSPVHPTRSAATTNPHAASAREDAFARTTLPNLFHTLAMVARIRVSEEERWCAHSSPARGGATPDLPERRVE